MDKIHVRTDPFIGLFLQEKVASESLPLLGFTVKLPGTPEGVEDETNIFQLYHKNTLYYTFKARDNHTAQRSEPEHRQTGFTVGSIWKYSDNSV